MLQIAEYKNLRHNHNILNYRNDLMKCYKIGKKRAQTMGQVAKYKYKLQKRNKML